MHQKKTCFLVSISLAEYGSHTFPLIVMFCDSPRCSYGYSKRACEKFKYSKREERERERGKSGTGGGVVTWTTTWYFNFVRGYYS